jgi:hypothetical protein
MKQDKVMSSRARVKALHHAVALSSLLVMIAFGAPALAEDDIPFSISVDGVAVDGSTTDATLKTDTNLNEADIQVKFDGLGVHPVLNVSTFPIKTSFLPGETIRFLASMNYGAWVSRGEVRILNVDASQNSTPVATIAIAENGAAEWAMPDNAPDHMIYVLRVYDGEGRYDETKPLPITKSGSDVAPENKATSAVAPGHGEDRTAIRNISVYGGAVTVYGKNIPEGIMWLWPESQFPLMLIMVLWCSAYSRLAAIQSTLA